MSGYTTGVVLSELCDNGMWYPVGFMSKSLVLAKQNYATYACDKELLSDMCGLEEWKHIPGCVCNTPIYHLFSFSTILPTLRLAVFLPKQGTCILGP